MKKRIIEEYMDNFASALIISLIEKAIEFKKKILCENALKPP
jgi:hypothetical protein